MKKCLLIFCSFLFLLFFNNCNTSDNYNTVKSRDVGAPVSISLKILGKPQKSSSLQVTITATPKIDAKILTLSFNQMYGGEKYKIAEKIFLNVVKNQQFKFETFTLLPNEDSIVVFATARIEKGDGNIFFKSELFYLDLNTGTIMDEPSLFQLKKTMIYKNKKEITKEVLKPFDTSFYIKQKKTK